MEQIFPSKITRRACLTGTGATLAALLAEPKLLAQDGKTGALLQSMSSLTGANLQPQWVDPTAALVSVIVEISGSLRSLDLGEIEPATTFSAG
jgi:hypothetical protein